MHVSLSKTARQIHVETPAGKTIPPESFHILYHVMLHGSGESWAIDPTSAQYGYRDPLCPWDEVESVEGRDWKDGRMAEFGSVREKIWLKIFPQIPGNPSRMHAAFKMEKALLCHQIEDNVDKFLGEFGGHVGEILKGSDSAFAERKDKFLVRFDDAVEKAMVWLYSGAEIQRRERIYAGLPYSRTCGLGNEEKRRLEKSEQVAAEHFSRRGY